ncbi:malto-oligosyltrehalose synthase [Oceanidesulfovibrio marinus]|uniref:Malto-oligosyltrehalose synthase n=1 Tax=Oceanidesulfovibrio marinus TaxID=370038 RepID=A0ABX6NFD4_9BACT|nr:malto-oligosyltrehalose synthase [Oceanidesulfovibrio marinus]QJT09331.1 malto-oligosyltrehalose synthase [Oceanidesulfovibrio marinus]
MTRIPRSTYRLQLCPEFVFEQAREIVPYLAELGISHIYASPIFTARPGSMHGYDVCDPTSINPELGGETAFKRLTSAVSKAGMGWIQDIVPNHMAVSGYNLMLVDLLENGPASKYYPFFDIEWDHPLESFKGRMLAPFLGSFYGETLERGEIRLGYDEDGFFVSYYDLRLPLALATYARVLTYRLDDLTNELGLDHPDVIKLMGLLYTIKTLPEERAYVEQRQHQVYFIKRILAELYETSESVREFLDENLAWFNGERGPDTPERFDLLDALLGEQYFRLSFWKVAGEEINYRRFFSINDLISLRAQDEEVFNSTHSLILDMVRDNVFDGLRIDHIDGLYDPTAYLKRLRDNAPDSYIVVEKILTGDEPLPGFWPIQGATGYEFMGKAVNFFVNVDNEDAFDTIYKRFTGRRRAIQDIAAGNKRRILERHMGGDVENMARLVNSVSSKDRHAFDITFPALRRAITELLIRFPVYRTYISNEAFRPADLVYIRTAIRESVKASPELSKEFDFLDRFLLLEFDERISDEDRREWINFVMRFQQVTGPLMAKGVEDTTFYVANRLLCLNEVGGEPWDFGVSDAAFHTFLLERQKYWPHAMNATATHDHKRGEDARVRLAVLSELPDDWRDGLKSFERINRRKKTVVRNRPQPTTNDEYFIYQTLLATWPFDWPKNREDYLERIKEYMVKALREGKENSNWIEPDEGYETACLSFVEALLSARKKNAFLREFMPLAKKVAEAGMVNSLAQLTFKLMAPGVPDFYQGVESWDLSLVDPDNRRPVDYAWRTKALAEIKKRFARHPDALAAELLDTAEDGRVKLFATHRGLAVRNAHPELFAQGEYLPLEFEGGRADRVFGFVRQRDDEAVMVLVPRFTANVPKEGRFPLAGFWQGVHITSDWLPNGAWTNAFTGQKFEATPTSVRKILADFPVAVLLLGT